MTGSVVGVGAPDVLCRLLSPSPLEGEQAYSTDAQEGEAGRLGDGRECGLIVVSRGSSYQVRVRTVRVHLPNLVAAGTGTIVGKEDVIRSANPIGGRFHNSVRAGGQW